MRSTDIARTQHPAAPHLQLAGNNSKLVRDREPFYCTDLIELEPISGVTLSIHPALLGGDTTIEEAHRV